MSCGYRRLPSWSKGHGHDSGDDGHDGPDPATPGRRNSVPGPFAPFRHPAVRGRATANAPYFGEGAGRLVRRPHLTDDHCDHPSGGEAAPPPTGPTGPTSLLDTRLVTENLASFLLDRMLAVAED